MLFWRIKSAEAIVAQAEGSTLKRSLGATQLTLLGIGAVIGNGIFVLTAEAATKAGPAMLVSFVIAGLICCVTALAYAELASSIPVSGSAYTYTYATFGEPLAWAVGWALILEYTVSPSAVAVGWSGYVVSLLEHSLSIDVPNWLVHGPFDREPGLINLPALCIALFVTALLYIGTRESARFNALMVMIKLGALGLFLLLTLPNLNTGHYTPFMPTGFFSHLVTDPSTGAVMTVGVAAAAASIFFAYVGFDAVSTAAEEAREPRRTIPIGIIASLAICICIYLAVAVGAIGAVGAQPDGALARSHDALAFVLRDSGYAIAARVLAAAAGIALPSAILVMLFGQIRVLFVMARDGLMPPQLARVHKKYNTPHIATVCTGLFLSFFAALFPVGRLAEFANSGTLFAFTVVSLGVLVLRVKQPHRPRSFRTPLVWVVCPLSAAGCCFLFFQLPASTRLFFLLWIAAGLLLYVCYGRRKSKLRDVNVDAAALPEANTAN